MYRKGSPATFEAAWQRLLEHHPRAIYHLQNNLYPDRQKWAWAWVGTRFTAGVHTTARVETKHKNFKQLGLGPNSTLTDVFDTLAGRSNRQRDQAFEQNLAVQSQLEFMLLTLDITYQEPILKEIRWVFPSNIGRVPPISNTLCV